MKYEWKYGENDNQKYYDVTVGKDYLCVFANKCNSCRLSYLKTMKSTFQRGS